MDMKRYIVCLANSYKRHGRCVAGIEVVQEGDVWRVVRNADGSPRWLRPICRHTDYGEVPNEVALPLRYFDILEFEAAESCPDGAHSENIYYASIRKSGKWSQSTYDKLSNLCDEVHPLLFGSEGKSFSEDAFFMGAYSLMLVKVSTALLYPVEYEDYQHKKYRITFTYKGYEYDMPITDPVYLRQLEVDSSLCGTRTDLALVLSIGLLHEGRHHKLVVTILDPYLQMEDARPATPLEALQNYFGYSGFWTMQEEAINAVLRGKDSLVLMPTGGGKSLCYQIPALMLEGTAVVVSPLISLMKDQVDALALRGIPAAPLNSSNDTQESRRVMADAVGGKLKLLYISPERLMMDLENPNSLLRQMSVSLFAIDEAHCISHWGHDFRPEYTQLGRLRDLFPAVPVMALTATADRLTRKDILEQLRLVEPEVPVSTFDRPNLSLDVRRGYDAKEKVRTILSVIRRHQGESGIIYCLARNTTEDLARKLQSEGIEAASYHANLTNDERRRVQEDFKSGRVPVICATIAFGMGIDKPDVRFVIHYNLPKSIESFYQEIGRGGRDGKPCETILFYNLGDINLLKRFAQESGQQELNNDKLERMREYAESSVCRRRILLNYFGEERSRGCGNCDVCLNPPKYFDGTKHVQMALSAILRAEEKVGFTTTIDILKGSTSVEVRRHRYDQLKTFGAGRDTSARDWKDYLLQMLQMGFLDIAYEDHQHLRVTPLGRETLMQRRQVQLVVNQHEDFSVEGRREEASEEVSAGVRSLLLRNVATFDDGGERLEPLSRINIIYGNNGTGKSTIARVLSDPQQYVDCKVEWGSDGPLTVLTYNREFRERNLSQALPGVYTLGEASVEAKAAMEAKRRQLETIKAEGFQIAANLENQKKDAAKQDEEFRDKMWTDVRKGLDEKFKPVLKGASYKDTFLQRLLKEYERPSRNTCSWDELGERANAVFGERVQRMELIPQPDTSALTLIEKDGIFLQPIVGHEDVPVAALIRQQHSADWVHAGLHLLDSSGGVCPFCQQEIDVKRIVAQFNDFFDRKYADDVRRVVLLTEDYRGRSESLMAALRDILAAQRALSQSFLQMDEFSSRVQHLGDALRSNIELMQSKQKEPSRKMQLLTTEGLLQNIFRIIHEANAAIQRHNAMLANAASERDRLTSDVWSLLVKENESLIAVFLASQKQRQLLLNQTRAAVEENRKQCRELLQEISQMESSMSGTATTIHRINRLLEEGGYTNFRLAESPQHEGCYQIERPDGSQASDTLSDGEQTLLTLLYFVQMVQGAGREGSALPCVVVLDDPVSNLDSQALEIVAGQIQNLMFALRGDESLVRQIILLTHSIPLHNLLTYSGGSFIPRKDVRFWVLKKVGTITNVEEYGNENPIAKG